MKLKPTYIYSGITYIHHGKIKDSVSLNDNWVKKETGFIQ